MATVVKSFDPTARASATSIAFRQMNLETAPAQRPEVVAVIAQAATSKAGSITANVPVLSDGTPEQAFALFGASPLYYSAEKLFPKNGDGAKCPVYFVPIADGTTASAGDITFTGTATKTFTAKLTYRELPVCAAADAAGKIATNALLNPARAPRGKQLDSFNVIGLQFVIPKGTAAADIPALIVAAVAEEPSFPATVVDGTGGVLDLTAKWKGATGDFEIGIVDSEGDELTAAAYGLTTAYTQMTGGADSLSVETALDNLTDSYGITRVVNQFDDDTNLDLVQAWGEGLRDSLTAQYAISYFGREYTESGVVAGTVDVAAMKTFGDGRRDDAVNCMVPGTYGDLRELIYTQRDTLVKAGITNIEIRGGIPTLMDVVTFYHPEGVTNPIFRYDNDITKIGNLAYDLQSFFGQAEWESKIIVSVNSTTNNPDAITINTFAAAVNGRADLWEKTALIASAAFVKENSIFEIDGANPNRINANIKAQLSSTLRIVDNTLFLGFLFGESA